MDEDPISQFFPGEESVNLYQVLDLKSDATLEAIKKSYRRLALIYHPDKHATASEKERTKASTKFQQVGFAYAVLSDEKRKARYDKTGRTDEGAFLDKDADAWEMYFEELFERVTRGKLDEMKKEYQGSAEELSDLRAAYVEGSGSIVHILNHIPHSTYEDEERFVTLLSPLIASGELPKIPRWEKGLKDDKARKARKKAGEKEAKEAEGLAKELGVWDEFFGSGKKGERKTGKGKAKDGGGDTDDTAVLQAMIKRRAANRDGFFDNLAAKYTAMEDGASKRGKKRGKDGDGEDESPRKKSRKAATPELDDEAFEKVQKEMLGKRKGGAGVAGDTSAGGRGKATKRTKSSK